MLKRVSKLLTVVCALLLICLVAGVILWRENMRTQGLEAFAAQQGLHFRWSDSPIALPEVEYGGRTSNRTDSFLWGRQRDGIEVFSCDFRIGEGQGRWSVEWLSMVGVHAKLRSVNGIDPEKWRIVPLNGWTFLVPANPGGGTLKLREITSLWGQMTALAVR